MAFSQCLEDSPAQWTTKKPNEPNFQELYNESHRLALEELVSGGVDRYLDFLKKERIPNFISDDELRRIVGCAVVPRCASVHGGDPLEQSVSGSLDCSSVTYFPEISDLDPPLLEVGWPAFTAGSYRGVTRAVAHFQPSYGECIYSCKEAARRLIKSAKEVIAIVTDSLTDLDIFKDLHEACTRRNVPVYILLDRTSALAFLKMCDNISIRLEDLQQMRVRTLNGTTYYMRSGASISGKVHERFMLIDGNRVATGSYRFNWTDSRLNSSNLIELSGQITENFDEEFRVLYAQSLPISTQVPPSAQASSVYERLLAKHPVASSPHSAGERTAQMFVTSTPGRKPQTPAALEFQPCGDLLTGQAGFKSSGTPSESSTLGDAWVETQRRHTEAEIVTENATPYAARDVATQVVRPTEDRGSQTEPLSRAQSHCNNTAGGDITTAHDSTNPTQGEQVVSGSGVSGSATDANPRDRLTVLTKERQRHYSSIRTKLENMVCVLSQRRELGDVTNVQTRAGAEPSSAWRKS